MLYFYFDIQYLFPSIESEHDAYDGINKRVTLSDKTSIEILIQIKIYNFKNM